MPSVRAVALSLALAGWSTACTYGEDDSLRESDLNQIHAMRQDFAEASMAGDIDRILANRTDDAVWLPPNAPAIEGKAAIRAYLAARPRPVRFEITPGHTDGRDDIAIARGTYVYATVVGRDTVVEPGKYLQILQRQPDESWLVAVEIWNSSAPLPTAPKR